MLAEIAEQPAALERTIAAERGKIAKLGNTIRARGIDLIVLVARGSSDNAALFGRYCSRSPPAFRSRCLLLLYTRSTARS
jgi:fructoselysine-6-P-deglycase FrlB-like protein